jgi:hypothetical protein
VSLLRRRRTRGQSIVEFAILVPLFMLLLLGMLEFGLVFTHHQTLEYATREGARTGAALANGGGALGCGGSNSPKAATVDPQIIAAVERVLTSEGSPIKDHLSNVQTIHIYLGDVTTGNEVAVNNWTYKAGGGPVIDGKALDFVQGSVGWSACNRDYTPPADPLGVSITYRYPLQTGLGPILGFFGGKGWTAITMSDRTVMNVNPTNPNFTP